MIYTPNPEQWEAIQHLFGWIHDPGKEGEEYEFAPTIELIKRGRAIELCVEGAYLHRAGYWATFSEIDPDHKPKYSSDKPWGTFPANHYTPSRGQ